MAMYAVHGRACLGVAHVRLIKGSGAGLPQTSFILVNTMPFPSDYVNLHGTVARASGDKSGTAGLDRAPAGWPSGANDAEGGECREGNNIH